MRTLFLDTETTGLNGRTDRMVEIAIVDDSGKVLMNTLINPGKPIPAEASQIHGITDHMVRGAPTFNVLWPTIQEMVRGNRVVIYNANFDCKFFPQRLACAAKIECAMLAYAAKIGEPHLRRRGEYRWHKLVEAARRVGYTWSSPAHRALGDALACRRVWLWMHDRQDVRDQPAQTWVQAENARRQHEEMERSGRASAAEEERRQREEALVAHRRGSETPASTPATSAKSNTGIPGWVWVVIGIIVLALLARLK